MQPAPPTSTTDPPRRNFLKQFLAGTLTAVVGLVPGLASLLVFFDPLKRRSAEAGDALLVTRLASLPADGIPRRFQVLADRVDAWNTYRNIPVGAVYLRRSEDDRVTALNATCPHAGCSVSYSGDQSQYVCPCHDSLFALDGTIANATSPSPRALDALDVEVRNENEVWVKFQNFQPGHREKLPLT
jgi:Rieske Fe-S protein